MPELDVALHILDHQLLDADGRRCGGRGDDRLRPYIEKIPGSQL